MKYTTSHLLICSLTKAWSTGLIVLPRPSRTLKCAMYVYEGADQNLFVYTPYVADLLLFWMHSSAFSRNVSAAVDPGCFCQGPFAVSLFVLVRMSVSWVRALHICRVVGDTRTPELSSPLPEIMHGNTSLNRCVFKHLQHLKFLSMWWSNDANIMLWHNSHSLEIPCDMQ